MSGLAAWDIDAARALVRGLGGAPDAVLPMLQALQARFGYVDAAAVALVAEAVNLSRAEVHGTVSFYHDFRSRPPPGRVIRLCRAEAACRDRHGGVSKRLPGGWCLLRTPSSERAQCK